MRQLLLFPEKIEFKVGDRVTCDGYFDDKGPCKALGTVAPARTRHSFVASLYKRKLFLPIKLDDVQSIQCVNIEKVKHI